MPSAAPPIWHTAKITAVRAEPSLRSAGVMNSRISAVL
jgi:hypothetical protein